MFGFGKPKESETAIQARRTLQTALDEVAPLAELADRAEKQSKTWARTILASPIGMAVFSAAVTTTSIGVYWRYFRRIKTAEHITPATLRWRKTLVGRCVRVGDADGFRLYHQMPFPFRLLSTVPTNLKATDTLSIRLAGADAPESGHFGNEAQPFAKEAKEELKRLVENRTVWCEVAHVDQYKRLVATPYVFMPPYVLGRTNVALRMVKLGLATVYTQSGAAYAEAGWLRKLFRGAKPDGTIGKGQSSWGLRRLEKAQDRARSAKRGMWALKGMETPAEYKKRTKKE